MDLTTVERAKVWIEADGDPLSSSSDALLGRIVTTWSLAAEDLMDRTVTAATYTEDLDVELLQTRFVLKAIPITTMASVTSDTQWDFTTGAIATDSRTYDADTGLLYLTAYDAPPGPKSLRVVYAGGMAPSVTTFAKSYPDIADAVDQQVAYAWQRRKSMAKETESDRMGNRTFTGALNWLPHVKAVLLKHRRITFGR